MRTSIRYVPDTDRLMICDNCSAELTNQFCSQCGQDQRNYHLAFHKIIINVVEENFHFDGRVLNTLKLLILKPGELSKEFSLNRRAKYVPAVRLYLFASVLFFFIFALVRSGSVDGFNSENRFAPAALIETNTTILELNLGPEYRAKLELIRTREGSLANRILVQWANTIRSENDFKDSFINRELLPMAIDAMVSPQRTFGLLIDNFALVLFIGLPAHALILKFFYFGNYRRYYIEHLVFLMHVHTIGFFIFSIFAGITLINTSNLIIDTSTQLFRILLIFIFFIYQYVALKRYYEQGWIRTSCKFIALNTLYGALLGFELFSTAAFTLNELQNT